MNPYRENGVVREFVDRLLPTSTSFPCEIHPDDEMYRYNLESLRGCRPCAAILYYLKGWQIYSTCREVATSRFGGLREMRSFLDFGSGWGRATRFLITEVDPTRICVAEVRAAAVEFQRRAFGVRGVVTTSDPTSFAPAREFDCVLAASFFSHLPEGRFRGWMRRLVDLLSDAGVLILSTHGAALLNADDAAFPDGIAFFPESEAHDLDSSEYGTSYVTPEFVQRVVAESTDGRGNARCFPYGLCGYQDLYVVTKDERTDLKSMAVTGFPRGELDRSDLAGNRLTLEGWVDGGNGPSSLESVRLTANNVELAAWSPDAATNSGGKRRWEIDVDRSRIGLDDVLIVTAFNDVGLPNVLTMGTLRPYLAPVEAP
jgi:hypothetical protein